MMNDDSNNNDPMEDNDEEKDDAVSPDIDADEITEIEDEVEPIA